MAYLGTADANLLDSKYISVEGETLDKVMAETKSDIQTLNDKVAKTLEIVSFDPSTGTLVTKTMSV